MKVISEPRAPKTVPLEALQPGEAFAFDYTGPVHCRISLPASMCELVPSGYVPVMHLVMGCVISARGTAEVYPVDAAVHVRRL